MQSKFSYNIIGVILCFAMVSGGLGGCIFITFLPDPPPLLFMILILLFPIFTLLWLIFGEFRAKAIVLTLENDYMIIRRYFGIGAATTIYYSELDGFETSELASINMWYEYLYFVKTGKKIGKISAYYHRNYDDLKRGLAGKLKNLGEIKFSYWDEVKEIFK